MKRQEPRLGRILITGANGFIGRHVVAVGLDKQELLKADLRALLSRPREEFSTRFPTVELVCGDLLDEATLRQALAGVSAVVHLASKNVDHDGSGFERVNVEGTRLLARLAAEAGVRQVIYVSSVGVYGHGSHQKANETTALNPDTPFSRSKAAAEQLLLDHHLVGDFQLKILRHRFVYGDGDQSVLPRLIKAAKKYPFWIDGGKASMSFIWVRDLAQIIFHCLALGPVDNGADEPIYHVTDGMPITYREVITTICRAFDYQPPRVSVPLPLLYGPIRLRERLLGIDPETSASSITSIRLKLVAQDNDFVSHRLRALLPDFEPVSFAQGFAHSLDYYSQFR